MTIKAGLQIELSLFTQAVTIMDKNPMKSSEERKKDNGLTLCGEAKSRQASEDPSQSKQVPLLKTCVSHFMDKCCMITYTCMHKCINIHMHA